MDLTIAPGSYCIIADLQSPPTAFPTFVRWETSGGVSINPVGQNIAVVTVTSSGSLTVIYHLSHSTPSLDLLAPTVDGLMVSVNGVALPGTFGASITRINWDWGDGASGNAWLPATHTYPRTGCHVCHSSGKP